MLHPQPRIYYQTFAALMALLAVTIAVAQIDLGPWNFPAAAAIATLKGLLIILFFMHVRYSPPLTGLFAGASFFWIGILFVLTYSDYATRPSDRVQGHQSAHVGTVVSQKDESLAAPPRTP